MVRRDTASVLEDQKSSNMGVSKINSRQVTFSDE
jgi:hypothetical protein